jgi:hypothetical protein
MEKFLSSILYQNPLSKNYFQRIKLATEKSTLELYRELMVQCYAAVRTPNMSDIRSILVKV